MTGSTRHELTMKSARRLSENWFNKISYSGDVIFWVAEPFELKDGHHIHALLKTQCHFSDMVDLWQWATGNKANAVSETGKISWQKKAEMSESGIVSGGWNAVRLENYKKEIGAGKYVMKYILKKRCDYDLLFKSEQGMVISNFKGL